MDFEEALRLIEESEGSFSEKNVVRRGLQILEKYEDDVYYRLENGSLCAGNDFEKLIARMSADDVREMVRFGWFYDAQANSWAHN